MKRGLAKLVNELSKAPRITTLEETQALVDALKFLDKQDKIQALKARLRALQA